MHIKSIRTLSGPNIYSHRPVLLMRLDLDHLDEKETREFKGFNDRLVACLPGLNDHQCEVVREHLLHGGTAYMIEDGWLVERTRSETHRSILPTAIESRAGLRKPGRRPALQRAQARRSSAQPH